MHMAITRYHRPSSSTINYLIPAGLLMVGEGRQRARYVIGNLYEFSHSADLPFLGGVLYKAGKNKKQ